MKSQRVDQDRLEALAAESGQEFEVEGNCAFLKLHGVEYVASLEGGHR